MLTIHTLCSATPSWKYSVWKYTFVQTFILHLSPTTTIIPRLLCLPPSTSFSPAIPSSVTSRWCPIRWFYCPVQGQASMPMEGQERASPCPWRAECTVEGGGNGLLFSAPSAWRRSLVSHSWGIASTGWCQNCSQCQKAEEKHMGNIEKPKFRKTPLPFKHNILLCHIPKKAELRSPFKATTSILCISPLFLPSPG